MRPAVIAGAFMENSAKMNKWDVVAWWELRRIAYNLALLAVGLVSVASIEMIGGRLVPAGEDFVEPLFLLFGVIVYAVLANACYSLGWITELIWRPGDTPEARAIRVKLFRVGLILSVGLTGLPTILMLLLWAISGFK